ncbi:uncharacterized protein LOC127283597 [Leptopilina boulardi]|uniref:uncharacterized protein LOC127283597 n=1 Tax=Leptopilina boulardi TaxID=63433 RepID=UPI0021F660BD|nr:uncharacterized protein LOC127283597 [Leptopilina boulardi]
MAVLNNVILLEIILLITLCFCSNASVLNEEQKLRDEEIARLTALGMVEPELFYDLTHTENFYNNCPYRLQAMNETHHGIWYSYSMNGRQKFWDNNYIFKRIYDIAINIYTRNNLSSVLSFEDCFSIIHYTDYGFERIRDDTDEGRQMRNAFYRLAIVQSKDPNKYHNSILYRGQSQLNTWYEERYGENKTEELTRFTSTAPSEEVATEYAKIRKNGTNMISALYEMHFSKPFLSANIDNITRYDIQKETVLLPETKLIVNNRTWRKGENPSFWKIIQGNRYRVTDVDLRINVTHNDENLSIFEQQKKVMIKLKELKDSGTTFYVDCEKYQIPSSK